MDDEEKSVLSILPYAFSKIPRLVEPDVAYPPQKKISQYSLTIFQTKNMTVSRPSPLTAEHQGFGSFSIEDYANRKTSNCMEVDDFDNMAAHASVSLMDMKADLS